MSKISPLLGAALLAFAGCAGQGPSAPVATTTAPAPPATPDPKGVGLDVADLFGVGIGVR